MKKEIIIVWFRQDLRIIDNPALFEASKIAQILPIYILDDINPGEWQMGEASRWWLYHALKSLKSDLKGNLQFFKGDPLAILEKLIQAYRIRGVYWNRCYEPWRIHRDKKIKDFLKREHIENRSFNASLIREPWEVLKQDDSPYKVYTPFLKQGYSRLMGEPVTTLPEPSQYLFFPDKVQGATELEKLKLIPAIPWYTSLNAFWEPQKISGLQKLNDFLENGLQDYDPGRDYPSRTKTSRLSPYLKFGQISPGQIWNALFGRKESSSLFTFRKELVWREFSYYLLYHFPHMPIQNLKKKFDHFPWSSKTDTLISWKKGQTGIPLIDAGMRELWQTGQMHNRIRMITASFLVKNLQIHWLEGAKWFWDCLVDADLASNSASWQWVAGSGTDASPFFRIFNPVTQGEKYDEMGAYTRKYVPELADLPDKYLFKPWTASESILSQAGITLGLHYPAPMTDLANSRKEALEAYQSLKLFPH